MKLTNLKIRAWKQLCIAAFSIAIFACAAGTETKQDSLWQRGEKVLQSFGKNQKQNDLTTGEIAAGLKAALRVGTTNVVSQLGQSDGFYGDPKVHIQLPDSLNTVHSVLDKMGMSSLLDDLELRLNRAAETATPEAKELFLQAVAEMNLEDAKAIYTGPNDSATRYFQKKMSQPLVKKMRPIVGQSLAKVGAIQSYENVLGQYRSLPFVPDVKADLTDYVIEKGMDGIFYYLAREEAAIRENPAKRTTDLLKRVFGAKQKHL